MLYPTLLATLLLSTTTQALSSHSPQDLFALPQYKVTIGTEGVLNETATSLLAQSRLPSSSSDPTIHLIRDANGQAFLCSVPPDDETGAGGRGREGLDLSSSAASREGSPLALEELRDAEIQRHRGLEKGLDLLEGLRGTCLYLRQGWFTYSLCYGDELRQFHAIGNPPQEDTTSEAYSLGQSPSPPAALAVPKYGSGSSLQPVKGSPGSRIPATLGGGGDEMPRQDGVLAFGGAGDAMNTRARYVSQVWDRGTLCDKTGMPRSVEVQFHCSTQSGDRIALVRETAICTYVVLVHTPRLCSEPIFLEGSDMSGEVSHLIGCEPIVNELRSVLEVEEEKNQAGSEALFSPEEVLEKLERENQLASEDPERDDSDSQKIQLNYYDGETGKLVDSKMLTQREFAALADDDIEADDGTAQDELKSIHAMAKLAQSMQESIASALIEPVSPSDGIDLPPSRSSEDAGVDPIERIHELIASINEEFDAQEAEEAKQRRKIAAPGVATELKPAETARMEGLETEEPSKSKDELSGKKSKPMATRDEEEKVEEAQPRKRDEL